MHDPARWQKLMAHLAPVCRALTEGLAAKVEGDSGVVVLAVHTLATMLRFRMFTITHSFNHADECNALRTDPLFKLIVDQARRVPRPFVWNVVKIRDFIDSVYFGYPTSFSSSGPAAFRSASGDFGNSRISPALRDFCGRR